MPITKNNEQPFIVKTFIVSFVTFVIQTYIFLYYDRERQKIIPWRTFYFHIMCKKNFVYELEEKIKRGVYK